jgi:hypothetical protein
MDKSPLNPDQLARADKLLIDTAVQDLIDAAMRYLKLVHDGSGKAMLTKLPFGMYLIADPEVADRQYREINSRGPLPTSEPK